MQEEKEIYFEEDKVFMYSNNNSSLVVAAMREGIKLGCEFPAIDVECCVDGSYVISNGHHRALAYFAEGFLSCKSEFSGKAPENVYFFLFKEITLRDGITQTTKFRLADSLNHLPRDIVEKFCRENDLNPDEYLSQ